MEPRTYAHLRYPWRAVVDLADPAPARLLGRLARQAFRYGMPARRYGSVGARLLQRGIPDSMIRFACKRSPKSARPDLDDLRMQLVARWPALRTTLPELPDAPGNLSLLGLARSVAFTVFVISDGRAVLVCKRPYDGDAAVSAEATALERAAASKVAPRYIGRISSAYVQEAIEGAPVSLTPVSVDDVRGLEWSPDHARVGDALVKLASETAAKSPADELEPWVRAATSCDLLSARAKSAVSAAANDVAALPASVLRHGDTSVQNCIIRPDGSVALVDWELAQAFGVPGFDSWNFALAWLEHSLALRRWSSSTAVEAFRNSWDEAPFWREARTAARSAARAGGVSDRFFDALEVMFFARRLGRRLNDPARYAVGPDAAAGILEHVCAR